MQMKNCIKKMFNDAYSYNFNTWDQGLAERGTPLRNQMRNARRSFPRHPSHPCLHHLEEEFSNPASMCDNTLRIASLIPWMPISNMISQGRIAVWWPSFRTSNRNRIFDWQKQIQTSQTCQIQQKRTVKAIMNPLKRSKTDLVPKTVCFR